MQNQSMKKPLIASGVFHFLVVFLVGVGIPFVKSNEPIVINTPMMIELVELDDITQTNKPKPPPPKPKPIEEKVKEPEPPKQTAEAPPDLTVPPPPEIKAEPKLEEIVEAEPVPTPEVQKKAPPAPKRKPTPPKKTVTKKKTEPKKDFASLLKNYSLDDDEKPQIEQVEEVADVTDEEKSSLARMADRLTMSELDALRAQLAGCWMVMAGARNAEDLIVEVRVMISPQRIVQHAIILDQVRYSRDSHFRAAADAAVRALKNPHCSPLKLPADKYESWKTTVIRFDPSQML